MKNDKILSIEQVQQIAENEPLLESEFFERNKIRKEDFFEVKKALAIAGIVTLQVENQHWLNLGSTVTRDTVPVVVDNIRAKIKTERKQKAEAAALAIKNRQDKFISELKTEVVDVTVVCPNCKKQSPAKILWAKSSASIAKNGLQNLVGSATCPHCQRHLVYGLGYDETNSSKILNSDPTLVKASELGIDRQTLLPRDALNKNLLEKNGGSFREIL